MLKRVILALCATVTAACTATSVLSKSVYDHQVRAAELRAQGQPVAAAAELTAAQKDSMKIARIGYATSPVYPRM